MPFIGPPRNLTTTARNALATTDRPTGMIIWNTSTSQLEVNSGTPASPTWTAVNASTWDSTWVPRSTWLSIFSTASTTYVSTGLTITLPATGSYIIEWGAGSGAANNQGGSANLTINLPSIGTHVVTFGNVGNSCTSIAREFTSLSSGTTITVYGLCTGGPTYTGNFYDLWIKYSRFA